MPWGVAAAAVAATGTVIAANQSAKGARDAANTQANAAMAQQQNLLNAGASAAEEFQGYKDLGTLANAQQTKNIDYYNNQFSNADLNSNLAPNYAFQLGQGTQANLNASNATGGALSGNAQRALQDYSQNFAGTAYQQAFNNYQTQRGNIAAQNNNLSNIGLAGATGSANAQLGTATNVASLGMGAANAQAASQIAQGNIYGNAANSLGSIGYGYAQQQYGQQNQGLAGNGAYNNYYTGYDANATGGGNFTPTAGNSFTLSPA
jgi:hypothetical protein